jgi:anti-sigma-K factor RskA
MNDRADIDMLAAEYVLGTLARDERTEVESRRHREPDLDSAIAAWESRLDPLNAYTPSVAPPPGLFGRIQARLDEEATAQPPPSAEGQSAEVVALHRRVARWRTGAVAAGLLAACLAAAILVRETVYPPQAYNFVAVFNERDARPAFVLSIDLSSRVVTIRPVGAERHAGRSYQLWIASPSLGPAPQSLGLLNASLEPTQKELTRYEPALLRNATFGISLEPEGGSPTGRPTGPALHGQLIPATP